MKIKQITFKDFRQFYGEQTIHFSHDNRRNVTIVFGTNGAGKTTILNAIQWVLYETFSKDFEEQNRLVNDLTMSATTEGHPASAYVEIQFEHARKEYVMRRTAHVISEHGIQKITNTNVTLHVTDSSGANHRVDSPNALIGTMFPQRLSEFFFFNGERLGENAGFGFSNLRDEVKSVMGLVKFERGIRHLGSVRDNFMSELAALKDDNELQKLGPRLKKISNDRDLELEKLKGIIEEQERLSERISEIQGSLRDHEYSRELQLQRDGLEALSKAAVDRREKAKKERRKALNQSSSLPFMGEMAELTVQNSEDLRIRGELPRAIKVQFIDDLLGEGSCICGTPLTEGSHEHANVSQWRLKAGHAESEEAWIKSAAFASNFPNALSGFIESIRALNDRISQADTDENAAEQKLTEVAIQLRNINLLEVQNLESTLTSLTDQRDDAIRRGAISGQEIVEFDEEIKEINSQISRASANDAQTRLVVRRIDAIDGAKLLLQKEFDIRMEWVRSRLESGLKETYNGIINHEYIPHVDENLALTLKQEVGGHNITAAKSTAETHSLYLSFIAQLSKLNREIPGANPSSSVPNHDQFPIVMDAAFGDFDTGPKRRLLNALPKLSHQIIIFVSKDQGKSGVESALEDYCGKKIVLSLHSNKEDLEEETIEINDRVFSYMLRTNSSSYSVIEEVS
jgi:DNA sulfur modification protein DndD